MTSLNEQKNKEQNKMTVIDVSVYFRLASLCTLWIDTVTLPGNTRNRRLRSGQMRRKINLQTIEEKKIDWFFSLVLYYDGTIIRLSTSAVVIDNSVCTYALVWKYSRATAKYSGVS